MWHNLRFYSYFKRIIRIIIICTTLCQQLQNLDQGSTGFFCKGPNSKSLGFADYIWSMSCIFFQLKLIFCKHSYVIGYGLTADLDKVNTVLERQMTQEKIKYLNSPICNKKFN